MDLILSLVLVVIALIVTYFGFMLPFLGAGLLILSILKLIDVKGFNNIFKTYDLAAQRVPYYGYVYPFIEFILAICFLFKFLLVPAAIVLLIIRTIGIASLTLHLLSKKRKACACLGAKFRIPLTRFTLVEDIIMAIMAVLILI